MKFEANSIDDLLHEVYSHILKHGESNEATKGKTTEILSCELVLKNPIARVSRSESRGLIFSCLGELFWYLSGSNDVGPIKYYLPRYERCSEVDGKVHGGYGKRLFQMHGKYNQVERVIQQLKQSPTTRKAIIQLFDSSDLSKKYNDIPCTLNLQFTLRDKKLHMFTMMRSNDAYLGLPHDIFVFTMLQELIASELECELGYYHHYVVSMHIYDEDLIAVNNFINEGFMLEESVMNPMPINSYSKELRVVVEKENKIRNGKSINLKNNELSDYWNDIIKLFLFFNLTRKPIIPSNLKKAVEIKKSISNHNYRSLIKKRDKFAEEYIMKIKKHKEINEFIDSLIRYEKNHINLIGLATPAHYETLAKQLIDSVRRIEYVEMIGKRDISPLRKNPHSLLFDPLRAAWAYKLEGNLNEACWLIFLSTHFGKSKQYGWNLCADIYGGLGTTIWTWERITNNLPEFDNWYKKASMEMSKDKITRKFGNHRKYESLKYDTQKPLHKIVESYINWIGETRDHEARLLEVSTQVNPYNPHIAFDNLYRSMKSVLSFGRTGRFDFLTMLAKFNIINIEPLTPYLTGSTGPKSGANYLFYGKKSSNDSVATLNNKLSDLAKELPINKLPSQVLEDALCNWQKSQDKYIYFGG